MAPIELSVTPLLCFLLLFCLLQLLLQKYIHEHDAVREMLMAFQGYKNSFLRWARSEDGNFSFEACLVVDLPVHGLKPVYSQLWMRHESFT